MLLLLGAASAQLPRYPPQHSHACLAANASAVFAFCDTTLPVQDRVQDLVARLSLAQKIANRYDHEAENDALGLPDYNYNQEGLHGLGAQCFAATASSGVRCPSVFAAPPTLASSWNISLLRDVGDAISTEARAYNNFGGNRGYQNRAVDLNVWLPSINIARDVSRLLPRFSRVLWWRQRQYFTLLTLRVLLSHPPFLSCPSYCFLPAALGPPGRDVL
jgi:hypothetical protein